MNQQKLAVDTGVWPLYRFDPRLVAEGRPPLTLDSKPAKTGKAGNVIDYMANETRFRMIEKQDPKRFKILARYASAGSQAHRRTALYQHMASLIDARAGTHRRRLNRWVEAADRSSILQRMPGVWMFSDAAPPRDLSRQVDDTLQREAHATPE